LDAFVLDWEIVQQTNIQQQTIFDGQEG
jgi:hypothetical protein